MPRAWIAALVPLLATLEGNEARRVLKGCADAHYAGLDMETRLRPFVGDLPSFLAFLRSEWGWIVEHDAGAGVILVDENKSRCVCPLVAAEHGDLGTLCYCSEGFAERMFSAVTAAPVHAEVTESILRGGERCRYRIELRA